MYTIEVICYQCNMHDTLHMRHFSVIVLRYLFWHDDALGITSSTDIKYDLIVRYCHSMNTIAKMGHWSECYRSDNLNRLVWWWLMTKSHKSWM